MSRLSVEGSVSPWLMDIRHFTSLRLTDTTLCGCWEKTLDVIWSQRHKCESFWCLAVAKSPNFD